jgi:peptidoglycan/xylan/chitin deacetylase (PgdA/CDA1 family)
VNDAAHAFAAGAGALAPDASARTVILNFHGIGTPGRALEPGEARFWIDRDIYCAILDLIAGEGPKVQVTFDDGNRSDIEIGAPELEARGLSATFFVLAGRLDTPGSLAPADLRALVAAGHRIGTHGFDHVDWRRLHGASAAREFDTARTVLAAAAGCPVGEASVPFGAYDRRVLRALRARGMSAVHTSDRGVVYGAPFIRPRNCIRADTDLASVRAILAGREGVARRIRRGLGIAHKRLL